MTQALEIAYNFSDTNEVEYFLGEQNNITVNDHIFLFTDFQKSDPKKGDRKGYIAYWNCSNSGKVHTLLIDSGTLDHNILYLIFNQTVGSLNCHYPGQTPYEEVRTRLPFGIEVRDLIDTSMMIILCLGFTFTYMMDGFPNFAHTSYAGIGALVSFYLVARFNFNPYDTWPFVALIGGMLGVFLYVILVRPIKKRGGYQTITLTFTFLVVAQLLTGFSTIFSYYARHFMGTPSGGYYLGFRDFHWMDIPGIAIIGTITCLLTIFFLHRFLTQTSLGLSLRATAEREDLAATIGINIYSAHCASWFLSGALSALAGAVYTISRGVGFQGPDGLIIQVMAGSILGGLSNVYGAVIGGFIISIAEKTIGKILVFFFGPTVEFWYGLIPITLLISIMFFFPNGLTDKANTNIQRINRFIKKLKLGRKTIQDNNAT
jgi:branched-chain amino acid transport system permease protein